MKPATLASQVRPEATKSQQVHNSKQESQNNILYITNFSRDLTKKRFENLFCPFGNIVDISIFSNEKILIPYAFI